MNIFHVLMGLLKIVPALAARRNVSSTAVIRNGTVTGSLDDTGTVQSFLGIPYAEPPVGEYRLRQARPLESPFGNLSASEFGPACYGSGDQPKASEDCLTLNIWRPATHVKRRHGSLPVLVWFYGGGLTSGYTADPLYDGTNMTRISSEIDKPTILVSINYRLGALGFLNGRQMASLGLLNIGMLDQRLALRWIQENIDAFGGDSEKVTLFGHSAGAVSIYSHMMAYGGRDDGLFRGAIMQSGGAFPLELPNSTSFQDTFDPLLTDTECSSTENATASAQLDCIRTLPIDVFRSSVGPKTGQAIDGDFTRTSIQFALPKDEYVRIPVVIGSESFSGCRAFEEFCANLHLEANTDEGTNSAPKGVNTREELFDPLAQGFFRPQRLPNATVNALLDIYSSNPSLGCPYNTGSLPLTPGILDKQACSIFGDLVMAAPARLFASTLANFGVKTWRYRFNHLAHGTETPERGISTGAEQAYVFSNQVPESPWDAALAHEMSSAWVSFAHDLDPNPGGDTNLPHWPEYGKDSQSIVFNGFGSWIEADTYRKKGMAYIIDNVLPNGAL